MQHYNHSCEPVEVVYPDGKTEVTPNLTSRAMNTPVDYVNNSVGIDITADSMATLLSKMSLTTKPSADKKELLVSVPPTRSDILHSCDVMEDVAIAYGFNNIVETQPKSSTIAASLPVNKITDKLRRELAQSGYTEVLSFTLVRGSCADDCRNLLDRF